MPYPPKHLATPRAATCFTGLILALLFSLTWSIAQAAPQRLKLVRSKYYLIHSDLDDALIYDLGRRMDSMYAEYSRRLSDFSLASDRKPLDVYLFASKREYVSFTAGKYPNTGGIFMPGRNQLAAFLEGQRDTLRRTLQHEAFHQFAQKAINGNLPVWLNEGLAQLFEEAIWTGQGFLMCQVPPRRVRQLQDDIAQNRLLPFKKLSGLSPEQWSANLAADPALGATQYNQSWAIVHYMAYGDNGANGARLVKMLLLLSRGLDAEDAFEDAFGRNVEAFRASFMRYAAGIEPTVEATMIDHHEVLADLCAQLNERGKSFSTVEQFRRTVDQHRYKLKYTRGQLTWTAEPSAYFRDAAGKPLSSDILFFETTREGSLPDLVLRHPDSRITLRARFVKTSARYEHEVLVEPAGTTASAEQ